MAERKRTKIESKGAKDTKEGTEGDPELPEGALEALEEATKFQGDLEKIGDELADKVLSIEQEYSRKRRPVYKARAEVLRKIPEFWCTTLTNHPSITEMFTEDDLKVMAHCTDLDVEDMEDIKNGYKITLTFSANPYFSDTQLQKTFSFAEDMATSIKGTQPTWLPGMEPAKEDVGEKRSRGPSYRFMLWFMDEELEPGMHDELADLIRDEIWPNPVRFFTGAALEEMADDDAEEGYGYEWNAGEGDEGDEQEGEGEVEEVEIVEEEGGDE